MHYAIKMPVKITQNLEIVDVLVRIENSDKNISFRIVKLCISGKKPKDALNNSLNSPALS